MLEQYLGILLVKLAVAASLASILLRFNQFVRMLLREERTMRQQLQLAAAFTTIFGVGVVARVLTHNNYQAVDLGLEGCLLAGILGGYVPGLVSGVLVSIPAMYSGEMVSMPLLAGVGVLGGVLRDIAPSVDEIWRFSPFFDYNVYRLFRRKYDIKITLFQIFFAVAILFSEFLRWSVWKVFGPARIFSLYPLVGAADWIDYCAIFATTLFATALPLKIWNAMRNEKKLEGQQKLLNEARLSALTRQINPHFLFNTLNSVSALIRTNPEQARTVVYKLSNILRRLLRKQENLNPLREEMQFIEDYLSIEMVRFGSKLKFEKEIEPDALNWPVPSMILQPIVENSIRHGLSGKIDGGSIRIRGSLTGQRLLLAIEDDGAGIPEGKLATLFTQGIGISNVNERLKVLFGANYRMSIDSKPGEGTRTEIEVPSAAQDMRELPV